MIKAIAFDYGGVIEINEGDLFEEITEYLGVARKDWDKAYFSFNHLNISNKKGEKVLAIVAKEFNASSSQISHIKDLTIKFNKKERKLNKELIEIIKDLRNKDYKIALLSNNSVDLRQKLINQNIIDLFDEVIISSEVGYQKPHPKIFEILFSKLEIKNYELIFIDDTKQSLVRAEDIGYTPLLFVDNERLKEGLLKALNIK